MSLRDIIAKIPSALHKVQPSLLLGIDPSGDPVALKADADGNLSSSTTIQPSGAGWTMTGDAVTVDFSAATADVYSLRVGGSAGTVVQTMTVTYADSTKSQIVSVVRA